MPEGDTIHRLADRLRPALAGRELTRFEARRLVGAQPRVGSTIESVEARGKHLLIAFSPGLVLETHLRMTGSWHLYEAGSRWRKPAHLARVVIGVEGWEAVCFSAPVVRTHPATRDPLAHLGPDLTVPGVDLRVAAERFELLDPATEIGVALLDQRVACGVGNVFKSEVLHAARVDPFTTLAALDAGVRAELVTIANRQLVANRGPGRRQTVPGGLAVYGRARRPCRVCGTPIRSQRQGEHQRTTYWCPRCQTP